MLEATVMLLLYLMFVIGLPAVGLYALYKFARGFLAEQESEREEAQAKRKEAENDNLRLQLLRERRARRQAPTKPDDAPLPGDQT